MNKDYNNKFTLNIWCSFGDTIPCILIFLFLLKDGYYKNFAIFESYVTNIFKLELCIHVPFVHKIVIILFVITEKDRKFCKFLVCA